MFVKKLWYIANMLFVLPCLVQAMEQSKEIPTYINLRKQFLDTYFKSIAPDTTRESVEKQLTMLIQKVEHCSSSAGNEQSIDPTKNELLIILNDMQTNLLKAQDNPNDLAIRILFWNDEKALLYNNVWVLKDLCTRKDSFSPDFSPTSNIPDYWEHPLNTASTQKQINDFITMVKTEAEDTAGTLLSKINFLCNRFQKLSFEDESTKHELAQLIELCTLKKSNLKSVIFLQSIVNFVHDFSLPLPPCISEKLINYPKEENKTKLKLYQLVVKLESQFLKEKQKTTH